MTIKREVKTWADLERSKKVEFGPESFKRLCVTPAKINEVIAKKIKDKKQ